MTSRFNREKFSNRATVKVPEDTATQDIQNDQQESFTNLESKAQVRSIWLDHIDPSDILTTTPRANLPRRALRPQVEAPKTGPGRLPKLPKGAVLDTRSPMTTWSTPTSKAGDVKDTFSR